jgi:hypothetical protein
MLSHDPLSGVYSRMIPCENSPVTIEATTTDRSLLKAPRTPVAYEDANEDWLPLGIDVGRSFATEQAPAGVLLPYVSGAGRFGPDNE